MSFFQWDTNPWGQEILIRISWDLFWLAAAGGALFIIGHLVYRAKFAPKEPETASSGASAAADVPDKVIRHPLASRLFHWTMAASVLTLLATGFLPVLGIQFDWVAIHWIAGLVFIGAIIFHVVHASFWLNLRDIWISRADWKEWTKEVRHALGKGPPTPKPGKYPVDHRIYHHMIVLAGFGVMITGLLMMFRVDTIFPRNPYLISDSAWGWVYVIHGLSSVGLVGMIMAHIYFAVLPEKRWMTISMIAGWVTKKDFLKNHDPERWVVSERAKKV